MTKIAMAFGSFDILHPGHIHYLREASRYGNLIVVVARDESIKKLKGRHPVMDEDSRLEMIKSIRFVHKATLGNKIRRWNDMYLILLKFRPNVIAFGYDQRVDMGYLRKFLEENGLKSRIVRIGAFKSRKLKSSKIKKLLANY